MVMVIEVSSVDKGADISLFSQYRNEREFLWVPCSFVQRAQQGRGRVEVVDGGLVTFVPVKVNLNLKTETVEELKEKKKLAKEIQTTLKSASKMWELIKGELSELVKAYGDRRRTKITGPVEEVVFSEEQYIVAEDSIVLVTREGWFKRQKSYTDLSAVREIGRAHV